MPIVDPAFKSGSYIFYDIEDFELTNQLKSHMHPVHVLQFSPDGGYLASGDDDSMVMVHVIDIFADQWLMFRVQICETSNWRKIQLYRTGGMVRALAWHPHILGALVVGLSNGDLNKLYLREAANQVSIHVFLDLSAYLNVSKDYTAGMHLNGYIHAMSFNQEGSQIAVAFGSECNIVLLDQDPTNFGALIICKVINLVEPLFFRGESGSSKIPPLAGQ